MQRSGVMRQQVRTWAIALGFWALLVVAFAGQLVLTAQRGWSDALLQSLRDWLPWVLLSPVVAWLATRFPIERNRLLVSIAVHIGACVLAVLISFLLLRPLPAELNPPLGGPQLRFRGGRGVGPPFGPAGRRAEAQPPAQPDLPGQRGRQSFLTALLIFARPNIPLYWVIVSVVHAISYYRRSEERERKAAELEARLADAKLEVLRMQLHPHFLFNTLNAISTLVHKDANAADEMIANLSELLRATLETSQQEIPLRRELDFLNRYLEIQQVRFGERLRVEKEIDAAALDGLVPALILQPLVENAIRHGIEPQSAQGFVRIQAHREGDALRLAVRDSGSGPKQYAGERQGLGLANTRSRLQEVYAGRGRMTLNSGPDGGFSVELEIPFREQIASTDSERSVAQRE